MHPFTSDFYEGETFKSTHLDHVEVVGVTFQSCRFLNSSFQETVFRACVFRECTFKQCDFSLAKVDKSAFKNTRFEDSTLIGINWVDAAWGKSELQRLSPSLSFQRCVLNYSTFMGLTLEKVSIQHCIAKEVDFSEADLKQASCTFTDFENSRFHHTDLSEADFVGASNYFISPQHNKISQARFSLPEALSLLYALDIQIVNVAEDRAEK